MWVAVFLLGLLQCWAHRNDMNPDGISYIEMAEGAAAGNWHALVNGYWSPLYPFLIGIALRIFHPQPQSEFALVHGVNFVLYLASFSCFELFLTELMASWRWNQTLHQSFQTMPPRAFWAMGCLSFLWSSQFWLSLQEATPDVIVATLVYLATIVLLRIKRGNATWAAFVGLGLILGTAYLAKAAMFPLAMIFLACAFLLHGFVRGSFVAAGARTLVAFSVFCALASPLILALLHEKGRLTFGDSGRIAYTEYVDRATLSVHWQGEPTGTGIPTHPTRKILSDPPLYEFAQPVAGSYPPWYDPSYWYEGIAPHFSLKGQLWVLFRAGNAYLKMFSKSGALYVVFFVLFSTIRKMGTWEPAAKETSLVFLPSIAALALYALVLVEFRYVSPFVLVILVWSLWRVRVLVSADLNYFRRASVVMIAALLLTLAWPVAHDLAEAIRPQAFEQLQVAEGLHAIGVPAGARVGFIGKGIQAYWAHLAGARIVAEIPEQGQAAFLAADDAKKRQVFEKFGEDGVAAVVMKAADKNPAAAGWLHIAGTPYYVYLIPGNPSEP